MGVLVASSELEEIVAFSDKVIVLRDKTKIAELLGTEIDEDTIMRAIAS
jgi:simple sugar transport system ATP-binding protein